MTTTLNFVVERKGIFRLTTHCALHVDGQMVGAAKMSGDTLTEGAFVYENQTFTVGQRKLGPIPRSFRLSRPQRTFGYVSDQTGERVMVFGGSQIKARDARFELEPGSSSSRRVPTWNLVRLPNSEIATIQRTELKHSRAAGSIDVFDDNCRRVVVAAFFCLLPPKILPGGGGVTG